MRNNHGFSRRILEKLEEAARHLGKAEEAVKQGLTAYEEIGKAKDIIDEAVLREMRTKRMEDWLDRPKAKGE